MNKILKSTKSKPLTSKIKSFLFTKRTLILVLIAICIIFASDPKTYANSCLNAISIWSVNVLPVLFPFFVLTSIIVMLSDFKSNKVDKFFSKIYKTNSGSSTIYFLSILSGYPVGAKLVTEFFNIGAIDKRQAENMLSFCSVSGPMFILGTVGVCMFKSMKFGLIVLFSNIIASLLNGILYCKNSDKSNIEFKRDKNNNILSKAVYDSMINVLMVGAYICLSFLVIEMMENLNILSFISHTINMVSFNLIPQDIVKPVIVGIIEITRGSLELSTLGLSNKISAMLVSGIIGFGGLSVFMQSINFFDHLQIKKSRIFKQKLTQGIFAFIVAFIISFFIY